MAHIIGQALLNLLWGSLLVLHWYNRPWKRLERKQPAIPEIRLITRKGFQ